jgi:HAD superfamily hydrolase (TIGR01549 family)
MIIEMIKGIIFDMDGVISDTQKLHSKIESELLNRYGVEITPEMITRKYAGVRAKDFFKELLDKQNKSYNLDELMNEKWSRMKELALEFVEEVDGAVDLIKMFYKNKFPLAVVSSSELSYVNVVLEKLNIKDYFSVIISGDMVTNGKPNPEGFLLASNKINVPFNECLVIEDGISGMQAAKNAKMKCIGLVKDKNEEYPTKNLVLSLGEVSVDYINQLN